MDTFPPKDFWKRAKQIHSGIRQVALNYDIAVGFDTSAYIPEALNKLKRGFFKIPFFSNKKEWLRRIVVEDASAFALLAPHIRIELIHKGEVMFWNGYGCKLNYEVVENSLEDFYGIPAGMFPIYITICLGVNIKPFIDLLEGLDT